MLTSCFEAKQARAHIKTSLKDGILMASLLCGHVVRNNKRQKEEKRNATDKQHCSIVSLRVSGRARRTLEMVHLNRQLDR